MVLEANLLWLLASSPLLEDVIPLAMQMNRAEPLLSTPLQINQLSLNSLHQQIKVSQVALS